MQHDQLRRLLGPPIHHPSSRFCRQAANHQIKASGKRDKELGMVLYRAVKEEEALTPWVLLEADADPDMKPAGDTPAIIDNPGFRLEHIHSLHICLLPQG